VAAGKSVILVIMSHAPLRGSTDLHLAIRCRMAAAVFCWSIRTRRISRRLFEKQQKLWDDASKIDLFYWIDAQTKTVRHVVNKDGLRHREACDLMNIAA
jgi:hypothetical protein